MEVNDKLNKNNAIVKVANKNDKEIFLSRWTFKIAFNSADTNLVPYIQKLCRIFQD